MKDSILIFNLSGGLTDMKKNLISITMFVNEYKYKFTIKYCTARPQTPNGYKLIKNMYEEVVKNDYMYDVKNLFDEKTFLIYDNYISFEKLKDDVNEENTFDFYNSNEPWKMFTDKTYINNLKENYKTLLNDSDKKYINMGKLFHFYSGYNYMTSLISEKFNKTIIPSKKIIDAYNDFITSVDFPYNFIHYRYENDIKKMFLHNGKEFLDYTLDDIIESKPFNNNNLKIYIATTFIEDFYNKKLINKPIDLYNNLFYNKNKLFFFDENAFVDFLIGMNSVEVIGFMNSGFSVVLNKLKNTEDKYYNK